MKFVSDYLLMFTLAIVLGLSPVQDIVASTSKCMNMSQNMHHQMHVAHSAEKMAQNDVSQNDCCEQSTCDMSHCASFTAASTTSNTQNDMTYIVSNVYLRPSVSLIQFYPTSLYRPPKV